MSKELEALHTIAFNTQINGLNFGDELRIIEQALQRLEAIDNANPSEALRELSIIRHLEIGFDKNGNPLNVGMVDGFETIKQALLKAQEQEKENAELKKVLSIIKEKDVNIWYLTVSTKVKNYKDYNSFLMNDKNKRQLTQEEFDLLKRYCDEIK